MAIKFKITRREDGIAFGQLSWKENDLSSSAISGPFGKGELPIGTYYAKRNKLLDKTDIAYKDSKGNCWFQLLSPQFVTERSEIGIHPDGNKKGTEGCIGITEEDTKEWYEALKSIKHGEYVEVEVVDKTE